MTKGRVCVRGRQRDKKRERKAERQREREREIERETERERNRREKSERKKGNEIYVEMEGKRISVKIAKTIRIAH